MEQFSTCMILQFLYRNCTFRILLNSRLSFEENRVITDRKKPTALDKLH